MVVCRLWDHRVTEHQVFLSHVLLLSGYIPSSLQTVNIDLLFANIDLLEKLSPRIPSPVTTDIYPPSLSWNDMLLKVRQMGPKLFQ